MVRLGAHTSKVAFIQALITQWYWKLCWPLVIKFCEQFCFTSSQFIFLAAFSHDFKSPGHLSTYRTVLADSLQDVNAFTFWWRGNSVSIHVLNHAFSIQCLYMYIVYALPGHFFKKDFLKRLILQHIYSDKSYLKHTGR